MLKLLLLFLTLSGLHALPIKAPRGLRRSAYRLPAGLGQGVEHLATRGFIPDDFRQGTEPSRKFIVDLNTGLVQEHVSEMDRRIVPADVPVKRTGGGWVRVEELPVYDLLDGFRQGTEPKSSRPEGFRQGTEPVRSIPDGFRQGTEPARPQQEDSRQRTEDVLPIPDGFEHRTEPRIVNLARFREGTDYVQPVPRRLRRENKGSDFALNDFKQGTKAFMAIQQSFRQGTQPRMILSDVLRLKAESFRPLPDGFKQGTEHSLQIPKGFRQGTERSPQIPEGFRQGTEHSLQILKGFRQGTERSRQIPEGFRQGTEHSLQILKGFRQGTERSPQIPEGFRQGTEHSLQILKGFRQGTERSPQIPEGFRQETEVLSSKTQTGGCMGEVINGICFEFHPTPRTFPEAQIHCRASSPNAELASITSKDLHSRLVSLVTSGGQSSPVLTWLGATVKKEQASWVDRSEWSYSDWMPGQPNGDTSKTLCVEMFKIDERWWTVADCDLKRASICSYPVAV